jgi:hypothetical protein
MSGHFYQLFSIVFKANNKQDLFFLISDYFILRHLSGAVLVFVLKIILRKTIIIST